MRADSEKRLLQITVAAACLVPLLAGGAGILRSAEILPGVAAPLPIDLDSHFRYLSGLLFGIGIAFAFAIPRIERNGALVRALGLIVVAGGLARLVSLIQHGPPGSGHIFGLVMELGVVPAIMLWQARVARRFGR
ncbi:DUF4345 domain-containing protein [Allosphingosinicella indica]|uniref:DUF4345 domain-containing protein n=1 Tax=Allosphingosinicella indica TaxID=941907 RepID=A0A1X7FZD1_9SPHN|nr:DUF4345 domain-containing protein [Allosphingosinicella indica]SMF61484.1 protein of unknown function [Allosphingosinicella indica]